MALDRRRCHARVLPIPSKRLQPNWLQREHVRAVIAMPPPVPVAPLQYADVGISEFVCGDVPGIGGRIKCFPEDFQVNEVRLRNEQVVEASFELVACDARGRLVLGTEHWPREPDDSEGRVHDPLRGRGPGQDETAFRFVLVKRQADTLEALAELSRLLQVPPRTFSFSGIKDSWAVTAQEVCAKIADIAPIDVVAAVQHTPWMRVEQFNMIPAAEGPRGWLAPGRLLGNRFSIVIRSACAGMQGAATADGSGGAAGGQPATMDAAIRRAVKSAEVSGFINYVGLQRFAKGGVRSDLVGLAYLRADYPACIEALLAGVARSPAECAEGVTACHRPRAHWMEVWKRTNSPSATLRAGLPASAWAEKRVLKGMHAALARQDDWHTACRNAFLSLPKTIRYLYVHAYLDRLWNLTVSERVRRAGAFRVVAGDIVALDGVSLAEREADADAADCACLEVDEDDALLEEGAPRGEAGWKKGDDEGREREPCTGGLCLVEEGDCLTGEGGRGQCGQDVGVGVREEEGDGRGTGAYAWRRQVKVHVVTEEEAAAGNYAISDVVVPRAGHGLSEEVLATPAGKMLERYLWYDELDLSDGLEVEVCQQTTEEEGWHAVPCAFRRLIVRPSDVAIHFPPAGETETQTRGEACCDGALGAASRHGHCGGDDEDDMASSAARRRSAPPSPPSEWNTATFLVVGCLRIDLPRRISQIPRPNPSLPRSLGKARFRPRRCACPQRTE